MYRSNNTRNFVENTTRMEQLDYFLSELKALIHKSEDDMAARFGAKIYRSENGFTQDQIYTYGGREDRVFTLKLKENSSSYIKFGEDITVRFAYTLKERQSSENDVCALNTIPNIKAESILPDQDNIAEKLLNEGIDTSDIVEMIVSSYETTANTFPSKEKRQIKTLEVPFEVNGDGYDIGWMYGFLKKLKTNGVGLMPEDEAAYLAYKLILENENLTSEERQIIFDNDGKICNNAVSYHYLLWRKSAGLLNENQERNLKQLSQNRFCERLALSDKTLKDIGLNLKKFAKDFPNQAVFLLGNVLNFKDRNFNTTGKYPLYMDFKSFLHIYFRHTEELNICNQFADRDKFQLEEKDIMNVIDHVMRELNDEYQEYKAKNPSGRFYRRGANAYYYNGDYYNVDVNPDGSISTFYKGSGMKNK